MIGSFLERQLRRGLQRFGHDLRRTENFAVAIDYPVVPRPRYGFGHPPHPILHRIFDESRDKYADRLIELAHETQLARAIALAQPHKHQSAEPSFINDYFTGLDAIVLCGMLYNIRPSQYFEIGSGNSTKFARRAIAEYGLPTQMVSCDPAPRAEINQICDRVLRKSAEDIELTTFRDLSSGDVLFIDGSHRVFQNSDVTVVFLDIIPILKKGVIVHFHDILLPYDYPPQWAQRYYSEQYLLASYLLGGSSRLKVLMPNAFVSADEELLSIISPIWDCREMKTAREHWEALMFGFHGYSLWAEIV
jgi:Methyltransferase domain